MSSVITEIEREQLKEGVPTFRAGDNVRRNARRISTYSVRNRTLGSLGRTARR